MPSKLTAIGTFVGVLSVFLFFADKAYQVIFIDNTPQTSQLSSLYHEKLITLNEEINKYKNGSASLLKTASAVNSLVSNKNIAYEFLSKHLDNDVIRVFKRRGEEIGLVELKKIISILIFKDDADEFLQYYISTLVDGAFPVSDYLANETSEEKIEEHVREILNNIDFKNERIEEIITKAKSRGEMKGLLEEIVHLRYIPREAERFFKIVDIINYWISIDEERDPDKKLLIISSIGDEWVKEQVYRLNKSNSAILEYINSPYNIEYIDACSEFGEEDIYRSGMSVFDRLSAALCHHGSFKFEGIKYSESISTYEDCVIYAVTQEDYKCFYEYDYGNNRLITSLIQRTTSMDDPERLYWVDLLENDGLDKRQKGRLLSILLRERVVLDKGEQVLKVKVCELVNELDEIPPKLNMLMLADNIQCET